MRVGTRVMARWWMRVGQGWGQGWEDEASLLAVDSNALCLQVTFGEAAYTLPPYDPIEVINYFVRVEHENELARYPHNTHSHCMYPSLLMS